MKTIWKDLRRAFLAGVMVPVLLLPALAAISRRGQGTALEFAATEDSRVPVTVLAEAGQPEEENLEDYLTAVVLGEIPADFEEEALKAQAIAARTYTRKAQLTGGKHGSGALCRDPGCCQAYWDPQNFLDRGGSPEALERVRQAVQKTDGLVLTYEGELIEATYFACSGGRTEDAVAVWGADYPYLRAVDSPGEEDAQYFRDTKRFSRRELEQALNITLSGDSAKWLGEIKPTSGGGVDSCIIGGKTFSGTALRQKLGLRSAAFSVTPEEDGLLFETRGYGHRVGLSQYGAQAMAQAGADDCAILLHYYPGTNIGKYVEKSEEE